MARAFQVLRAAVTIAVLGVFAALLVGLALDLAGDHGILPGLANHMDDSFSPIEAAESVPGFWPGLLFAVGIGLGMWLEAGFKSVSRLAAALRAARGPLEILYDPRDHRFLHREFRNGQLTPTTCVKLAIHNAMGDQAVEDVVISAGRNGFIKSVVEPAWGGRTCHIARIGPNATEFVEFFGLAEDAPAAVNGKAQRLVVRARAKDTKGTKARFELNANADPVMRRVS
jgi:hypothetical protein